jgi:ABC-2 type transport system permease protein
MNRILFRKEFRRNLPGLVIWSVVISLLVFFTMSIFRTFVENQKQFMGMLTIIPQLAMKMRGVSNLVDFFSVLGFYTANNLVYMMLAGSIYAIVLGSTIILKEEYNKTAEFLLSKPVTRGEIFATKVMVTYLNIFILNLIVAVVGFISLEVYKNTGYRFGAFLTITIYTFLLNLLFASLGVFLSMLPKRARSLTSLSIGIVLVFYFIFTISRITESVGKFGYFSPFKFVDNDVMRAGYAPEPWRLAYFIGISLVLIVVSIFIYRKKDILT